MEDPASQGRRREKPVLSCTFCRGRKLRCDRQSPCSACVRRGKATECTYTATEQERREAVDYRPHHRNQKARQRVARLESVFMQMRDMSQNPPNQPDTSTSHQTSAGRPESTMAATGDTAVDSMGMLSLNDGQAVYIGSSHWATILDDIQQLKEELSDEPADPNRSQGSSPASTSTAQEAPPIRISLLRSAACFPRDQILAAVPPRKTVDRLVSQFLNVFEFAPSILNRNKFLAEYAEFWANPSATPIMWVGLLFSIMSLSAFLQRQSVENFGLSALETQEMMETYRNATIHCLNAGDYHRPSNHTMETLILHFALEQRINVDGGVSNWLLIGVIIRIAFRMGYHRDPSHWPNIRPLQAELRRRTWITLYQMDFFTSTELGLPRIIKDSQCDVRMPIRLLEEDLGTEQEVTPPERPVSDATPLMFVIERHNIIKVAAEIYDATEAAQPAGGIIDALGAKLEKAIDAMPEVLKYKALELSIAEDPVTISHRIILDILKHKALYLLHRRSFMKGVSGQENEKSNKLCIDAALAVLAHQLRLDEETQPGGLMFTSRWKIASSLEHEFLQAVTILCVALNKLNEEPLDGTTTSTLHRQDDVLESLNAVKALWERSGEVSAEAQRATRAIATVLQHGPDKSRSSVLTSTEASIPPIQGMAASNYLGGFDYTQDMAFDPSFWIHQEGDRGLGNILEDFMTQGYEDRMGGT